ncbi:MAG TPA: DUF6614 family protein [Candidatus Deferrimicrobium sp.]|nr:DUF6614 family protein [Candidatus Deferrimicrobium sp.]
MNHLIVWCNLKDSSKDLEFSKAIDGYLGYLKEQGKIESYRLMRRKFGFGPEELGEFQVIISARDLAQLDGAFKLVASRTGEIERRHAAVYSAVKDLRSGLYRDFPDPERGPS